MPQEPIEPSSSTATGMATTKASGWAKWSGAPKKSRPQTSMATIA